MKKTTMEYSPIHVQKSCVNLFLDSILNDIILTFSDVISID